MRKLIVTNIVSLDGYVAGPGNNVMDLPMDHAFNASNAEHMRAADTILLGGTTYREMVNFWPNASHLPGIDEATAEIASIYDNGIKKVVVSNSLTEEDTGPWKESTRIVRRADAQSAVAERRGGEGGDMVVFGSPTLWNDLLVSGLVDEVHLMFGPVVLGAGLPAFGPGVTASDLRLIDVRRWEGSQNVLLNYAS